MHKQEFGKMAELIDNAGMKKVLKELGNRNNKFVSMHNSGSMIKLQEDTKHVDRKGKVKILPSGAKYRVDKNGCWRKFS